MNTDSTINSGDSDEDAPLHSKSTASSPKHSAIQAEIERVEELLAAQPPESLKINLLERRPLKLRKDDLSAERLAELSMSVRNGETSPIVVARWESTLTIIDGEDRVRAAEAAKLKTISAIVIDASPAIAALAAIRVNSTLARTIPQECMLDIIVGRLKADHQLRAEFKSGAMSVRKFAILMHTSKSTVDRAVQMAKPPKPKQTDFLEDPPTPTAEPKVDPAPQKKATAPDAPRITQPKAAVPNETIVAGEPPLPDARSLGATAKAELRHVFNLTQSLAKVLQIDPNLVYKYAKSLFS